MTILGLAGVLFWELRKRASIDKMDYHVPKKILGCLGKLGEVLKKQ